MYLYSDDRARAPDVGNLLWGGLIDYNSMYRYKRRGILPEHIRWSTLFDRNSAAQNETSIARRISAPEGRSPGSMIEPYLRGSAGSTSGA